MQRAFHDTPQSRFLNSIAASFKLPALEVEPRIKAELAVALYSQGILSFGKAGELAETSRIAFAELVSARGVARHYGETGATARPSTMLRSRK